MKRLHLYLNGLLVIRSQPCVPEEAALRMASWRNVFGQKADMRYE